MECLRIPPSFLDRKNGTRLDIKADGGDDGDDLARLELVEDGGLARVFQAHHQDPGRQGPKETVHQGRDHQTHCSLLTEARFQKG